MLRRHIPLMSWLMIPVWMGTTEASEKPILTLEEGDNVVFISVTNKRATTLNQLKVEVETGDLPRGVEIKDTAPQQISVAGHSGAMERFMLDIQVENGTGGTSFNMPITLRDVNGQAWTFQVLMRVREELPGSYGLLQNLPNPFNPSTTIKYMLAGEQPIYTRLEVFNSLGQKVRILVDATQRAGIYSVTWDGLDDQGQEVSSGVYLYRIVAGDFVKIQRMLLME